VRHNLALGLSLQLRIPLLFPLRLCLPKVRSPEESDHSPCLLLFQRQQSTFLKSESSFRTFLFQLLHQLVRLLRNPLLQRYLLYQRFLSAMTRLLSSLHPGLLHLILLLQQFQLSHSMMNPNQLLLPLLPPFPPSLSPSTNIRPRQLALLLPDEHLPFILATTLPTLHMHFTTQLQSLLLYHN